MQELIALYESYKREEEERKLVVESIHIVISKHRARRKDDRKRRNGYTIEEPDPPRENISIILKHYL